MIQRLNRKFSSLLDIQGWGPGKVLTRKADNSGFEWTEPGAANLADVATSGDYNDLVNKPIIGDGINASFKFIQSTASDLWVIVHNLNKNPSVTVTESVVDKVLVHGKVNYIDPNTVTIEFSGAMTGEAYLI